VVTPLEILFREKKEFIQCLDSSINIVHGKEIVDTPLEIFFMGKTEFILL
jgi:hypothetical protein